MMEKKQNGENQSNRNPLIYIPQSQQNITPQNSNSIEQSYYTPKDSAFIGKTQIPTQNPLLTPFQSDSNPNQTIPIKVQLNTPLGDYSQTNTISEQIQYQNYTNISQISHKVIHQPDKNTFYIRKSGEIKWANIFFFIFRYLSYRNFFY